MKEDDLWGTCLVEFWGCLGNPSKWSPRQAHTGWLKVQDTPSIWATDTSPSPRSDWGETVLFTEHRLHFALWIPNWRLWPFLSSLTCYLSLSLTLNIVLLMQFFWVTKNLTQPISSAAGALIFLEIPACCNMFCEYLTHSFIPRVTWLTICFTGKVWSHWA